MSISRPPTRYQVARSGEYFVAAELYRRGAYAVPFADNMPHIDLMASNIDQSRMVTIQVKTKRSGSWHTTIERGQLREDEPNEARFWIFVELVEIPRYYIVPEWWIQNDIHHAHQDYLNQHGGHRPRNSSSNHHSVSTKRIQQWHDRWDLLGIF